MTFIPMWHFICEHISDATQTFFSYTKRTTISGGDTHSAFVINDETHRYFVKINPLLNGHKLRYEMDGLKALSRSGALYVPAAVCHGQIDEDDQHFEYLVLQHLKLRQPGKGEWSVFGERLATLHRTTLAQQFGWHEDNYIGQTRQYNTLNKNWSRFFAETRIGLMMEDCARHGIRLTNIDVLVTQIHTLLKEHQPRASLLHGDLWSGNAGFCKFGPVIYDPAVYYGDREADIAMTELFGAFPQEFYAGYNQTWPLDSGYRNRKHIYNLYHLLNHALLFGGHYIQSCKEQISAIRQPVE